MRDRSAGKGEFFDEAVLDLAVENIQLVELSSEGWRRSRARNRDPERTSLCRSRVGNQRQRRLSGEIFGSLTAPIDEHRNDRRPVRVSKPVVTDGDVVPFAIGQIGGTVEPTGTEEGIEIGVIRK